MKKIVFAMALIGATSVAALAQSSQNYDPTPYGYGFRVGLVFPQDGGLRGTRDTWTALGVDYNFQTSILRTGDSFLSADMISHDLSGRGGTIWPVMFGNRFFTGDQSVNRMYFIGGLGAVITDFDSTDVNFGGLIGFGMDMGSHLYIESRYNISKKVDGTNPNTLGFYFGYRF